MSATGIAAILRYWPGAVIAALGLSLGVMTALWYSRGRALDASEALAADRGKQITALQDEIIARAKADVDRLAAGAALNVQIQGYHDRTTILYRDVGRVIPVDRPCLPVEAVKALNEGR